MKIILYRYGTLIMIAILVSTCSNPHDTLNISSTVQEFTDSLKIAKNFLLKLDTEDTKNFYRDHSNNLFIAGNKVGSYGIEEKFKPVKDFNSDQKSFIDLIVYLGSEGIFSGYVDKQTNQVLFDYSYKQDLSPDNVRLIILPETETDLKNIENEYEVIDKYGDVCLVKFNDTILNFGKKY